MIVIRRAADRGVTDAGWLDSRHTFSFGEYHDPAHMGFRAIRVINDDRVAPGGGFPTHGHRDMEILSWVVEGALAHRDSMGTGSTIGRGEMQRMAAGTGVQHSEFNASKTEAVRFLQIWIMPDRRGHAPSYGQTKVSDEALAAGWTRVASGDESAGAMRIHNDVDVFVASPEAGTTLRHGIRQGRGVWLQVVRGTVATFDERLTEGDGLAVEGEDGIAITAVGGGAELLLMDCA